ncbi:MAG: oligopeptide/dipeptide ABC transporter ATP-binding protein [Pseudomonadota bacterium]|nr:oligopeptide/dipeptide ABC transporter ATP-binding protein [Pseudomonadota bacterium]
MNVLSVQSLCVDFPVKGGTVHALDDIRFDVAEGETLSVVGESGCGKSTLAKAVMRLIDPTDGRIYLNGSDITRLGPREMAPHRSSYQMIFQDPYNSLNARQKVGKIIARPMQVAGWSRKEIAYRMDELLEAVGLRKEALTRYPHEFSGGQRQRIGIARALALRPRLLVCDEPVSALDVSIRAQVINLLQDLQEQSGVSYLFISHDLSVIRHFSDRFLVMYLGRIVEIGPAEAIWTRPAHPYTQALLGSAPVADPRLARRKKPVPPGDLPSPLNIPPGCAFATRCPVAQDKCRAERPNLRAGPDGRRFACHFDLAPDAFAQVAARTELQNQEEPKRHAAQ